MKKIILIKYGEVSLKGANRSFFTNTLISNIRHSLKGFESVEIRQIQGRIIVENISEQTHSEVTDKLQKVFGIVALSLAYETDANMESIKDAAMLGILGKLPCSFKVEARRGDKSFALTSPEIAKEVGAHILAGSCGQASVDVHNPDYIINIEVRKKAYVYYEDIPCEAGLPLGTGGFGLTLLSGGIDSPVASWLMSRRGMKMAGVHFHSYPYTSLNARQKVEDIAQILSDWNRGYDLYMVSLTKIQEQIIRLCNPSYLTVILRRVMFKIAEKTAREIGAQALVSGESLGQVASQTIESITCTNEVLSMPILRPLIGNDKNEIVRMAKHIGTFETSILPYEDCCTIFVPKHPQTKPDINKVISEESKLDVDELMKEAIDSAELIKR